MIATLALQAFAAEITIISAFASRAGDKRMLMVMHSGMILQAAIPIIGMILLMILGMRRARQIGESTLIKSLLIMSCLTIPVFYWALFLFLPYVHQPDVATKLLKALTSSGFCYLLILCLSLRGNRPWSPRRPRAAMAACSLAMSTMLLTIVETILTRSIPSAVGHVGIINLVLIPTFAWIVLIDREGGRMNWSVSPFRTIAIVAALFLFVSQIGTRISLFHRIIRPDMYTHAMMIQSALGDMHHPAGFR
jgi:hypothetical protein